VSLAGKVVLVTGATSGIGAACARAFAEAKAAVLLTGRDEARGQLVLRDVAAKGAKGAFLAGDVAGRAFCDRVVGEAVRRFGRLDILVNNAGVYHAGDATETSDEAWRDTMAVNVDAAFFLSRAAVPAMRTAGGGSIVNVASNWGLVAAKGYVAYCASKGAVVQLTRAMALDHAPDNIRVNAVCPGPVLTPMLVADKVAAGAKVDEALAQFRASVPMGRAARPEEIAGVVLFLASDEASYVTGAMVAVDGGDIAR